MIKVRGAVTEYNGRLQMRVDKFRPQAQGDQVELNELVAAAPTPPDEMIVSAIDQTIAAMQNPGTG